MQRVSENSKRTTWTSLVYGVYRKRSNAKEEETGEEPEAVQIMPQMETIRCLSGSHSRKGHGAQHDQEQRTRVQRMYEKVHLNAAKDLM